MISGIEKLYCRSKLHAYLWRRTAKKILPVFLPYFPSSPHVLEIGTGQGLGAVFLAEELKGSSIAAVDNEHDMVKAAAQNVKKRGLQDRIRVEYGDALALDFPDGSFDAVLSITVLHHVPHYEKAIAETARVLRQGGMFMIMDFDFRASIFPKFEILIGQPASIFSWSGMEDALIREGFEVLKVESYALGMFASVCVKR